MASPAPAASSPRYGISRLTLPSDALMWSTVGINIAGSFVLGLLVAEHWFDRDVREALGVGFLGGFTTFSTFSVQIVLEVDAGEPGRAAWYLLASVAWRRQWPAMRSAGSSSEPSL